MPIKPFRKRNPIPIGAASIVTIALILLASLSVQDLPLIGQGPTYSARFAEAAGLQPDDDIRVAGVRVGKVTDLELEDRDVVVSFKAPDAFIGDRSSASIEIKTVLGQKYIAIEPAGEQPLSPDTAIPRDRTRSPYDVITAFSDLSTTVQALDTDQLGQSLGVLSETLDGASGPIRPALDGLSALSRTIASRDEAIGRLLANTRMTTQVLADRDAEIQRILTDGNLLLGELRSRKQAIDALLTGTRALSLQLTSLVRENEAALTPTLEQLNGVLTTLQQNSSNLENGLRLLAPFIRVFTNVIGTGRWFDAYICNLDPPGDQACTQESGGGAENPFADLLPNPEALTNSANLLGVPLLQQALGVPDFPTAVPFGGTLPTIPGVTLPGQTLTLPGTGTGTATGDVPDTPAADGAGTANETTNQDTSTDGGNG